jgi:uncharacterized damage-inducible protein DinB
MPRLPDFLDQTERIVSGDPWYGDAILRVLEGVTWQQAAAHPLPRVHSIWELVLHMTSWVREVTRRLVVGRWQEPEEGDWPAVPAPSAENWRTAVAGLEAAHRELRAALRGSSESRLDAQVGSERDAAQGTGVTFAQMVHGILQHDAYHLGQIGLLKKALQEVRSEK